MTFFVTKVLIPVLLSSTLGAWTMDIVYQKLKKAKELRDIEGYKTIYISPNRTRVSRRENSLSETCQRAERKEDG